MGAADKQDKDSKDKAQESEPNANGSQIDEPDDVVEESVKSGDEKKKAGNATKDVNSIKIAVPSYHLPSNRISCAKHSIWTFVPATILSLLRSVVFDYNLAILVFQCVPSLSITDGFPTAAISILTVIVLSLFVTAAEDLSMYRLDQVENNFSTQLLSDSKIQRVSWSDLYPGQIIKIMESEIVPADCILLYSSNLVKENCHVDTFEIDGQTNLLLKTRVNYPEEIKEENEFDYLNYYVNSKITFDEPNANISSFRGKLELVGVTVPLGPNNLLLRKSKLCRTDFVYAVVIYTGHNTKAMQMQLSPREKSTDLKKRIDKINFYFFLITVGISLLAVAYNVIYMVVYQSSMASYINYDALNYMLYIVVLFVRWLLVTL